MDIIKVFGDNLKKYRKAMGISQEAFAESVVCTVLILALSSVTALVSHLKIFSV